MRRIPAPQTIIRSTAGSTLLLAFAIGGLAACDGEPDETVSIQPTVAMAEPTPSAPAEPATTVAEGVVTEPSFVVPENVSYEMAETAFIEKRYGEAVAMLEVYTVNTPANPWGHYMLGLSAWKSGDRERAVTAFDSSLALDPNHVKSLVNLGRVLLELGRADEALVKLETARTLDSGSVDVYRVLGRTYGELDRTEEAIDSYRRAIVIDGKDAWSMNNLGFLLINAGRFEEALLPLARAVELRGDAPVFRNNLGVALERTGHFTLAAESFRKAVELDSTYTKASISFARVEQLKEKPETIPVDLEELARRFVEEMEGWVGRESLEHSC